MRYEVCVCNWKVCGELTRSDLESARHALRASSMHAPATM